MSVYKIPLLQGYGIELEYMVVDARQLNIRPIVDQLFKDVAGEYVTDIENDLVDWSNELVRHVVELKNSRPVSEPGELLVPFENEIRRINSLLQPHGARLMPTAMHPWMDPRVETELWPHEGSEIYQTYHRLFDCHRHGWANLQSMHINLSFLGDEEFARLHAAVRLVLPLIPALLSSSPYMEGRTSTHLCQRLAVYMENQKKVPSIIGSVIPEPVWSRADYESQILKPMYQDLQTLDPAGEIQHEWVNSRAAIPKFARDSIEIRLADSQECPRMDLGGAWLVVRMIRDLVDERHLSLKEQKLVPVPLLRQVLDQTVQKGEMALIHSAEFLRAFGFSEQELSAGEMLNEIVNHRYRSHDSSELESAAQQLVRLGPLARRIQNAAGDFAPEHAPQALRPVYAELCRCLSEDQPFEV